VPALIPNEKLKLTSNKSVCAQVSTKIKAHRKINNTQIFVDEVESQLREKTTPGQPNPGILLFRRQS